MKIKNILHMISIIVLLFVGQVTSIAVIRTADAVENETTYYDFPLVSEPFIIRNEKGMLVDAVLVDQQISFVVTITLHGQSDSDEQVQYTAILEVRDQDNVTLDIQWQNGSISAADSQELAFNWKPTTSGTFSSSVFVISSSENPVILSAVSDSSIKAVDDAGELEKLVNESNKDFGRGKEPSDTGDYTFMVYMVGSDLETDGHFGSEDIAEMMSAPSTGNVNVIVETGGAANATIDGNRLIDFTKVQRHRIIDGEIETLEDLGEKNMGDAATLTEFLKYGVKEFPAERYAVVLWNDGSGINGFGTDTIWKDVLTLSELQDAFSKAKQSSRADYELIGFDACLMATYEVITGLHQYGKYMISSEELEPSWGWDYKAILEFLVADPSMTGFELGKFIADSYVLHIKNNAKTYHNNTSDESITLSVIDLSKIDRVDKAFADFSDALNERMNSMSAAQAFARTIIGTERFGFGSEMSSGYLDLYDIAENFVLEFSELNSPSAELQAAVDDAVLYKVNGKLHPKSSGVSIYLPLEDSIAGQEAAKDYPSIIWTNMVKRYGSFLQSDVVPPRGFISYNLSDKFYGEDTSHDAYRIDLIIYKEVIENTAAQVVSNVDDYLSLDSKGSFEYPFDKQFISLCNGITCVPTSMYIENSAKTKYAIFPVRLESSDINSDVSLIYHLKEDGKFEFIGAWPGMDEEGNVSRQLWPLQSGDKIFTKSHQFDIRSSDKYNMDIELDSIEVTDSFGPAYHEFEGVYHAVAAICDYAGNCMHSDDYRIINTNEAE